MRFNDAEYEALTARAASAGVSVQRFLADGAFASQRPKVAAPAALIAEFAGLRRLVRSLSNNINQIARRLNSGGRPDARVAGALDSVQRAMTRRWPGSALASRPAAPERRSGTAESPSPSAERLRPRPATAPAQRNAGPRAPA